MIAGIFYPIFTLMITNLVCFICIKTKLFRGFPPTPSPRQCPGPPGGLTAHARPPAVTVSLGLSKTDAPILFLYYPLIEQNTHMASNCSLVIALLMPWLPKISMKLSITSSEEYYLKAVSRILLLF